MDRYGISWLIMLCICPFKKEQDMGLQAEKGGKLIHLFCKVEFAPVQKVLIDKYINNMFCTLCGGQFFDNETHQK